MKHVFHPEAALEFEEAVGYYRARGRVLGDRFAAEVGLAIRRILETPGRWRVLEEDVRRCDKLLRQRALVHSDQLPGGVHRHRRSLTPGGRGPTFAIPPAAVPADARLTPG